MTAIISSALAFVVGAGIGWYVKGRGWFGVQVDASNAVTAVETDVKKIETEIKSTPTA